METRKRILITGGTGYLGSRLARDLADKHDVTILGRRDTCFDSLHIKKICKDLCELTPEEVSEFEVIFHLAALFPNNCKLSPAEIFSQNLAATHHLLNLIEKQNHPVKLIFSSSAGVYGRGSKKFSEKSHTNPGELYFCSKSCCEQLIRTYAYKNPDLKPLIFRISNLYGPEQKQIAVITETIKKILFCSSKNNAPLVVKNGSAARDFLYVDDCIKALIFGLEKDLAGTYNLGTGKGTKISALVSIMVRISKKEIPLIIEDDTSDINILNITKLKKEGWNPQTSLIKGLKQTYNQALISFSSPS